MKKFKFSLQTVHSVRELKRDSAERELAEANVELSKARGHLDEVLGLRQKAVDRYCELHQSRQIEATSVVMHTNYIGSLMELERLARRKIAENERHVANKRKSLVEASRQSEATANLRERQLERHTFEAARQEQNLLDEMAIMAVNRLRSSN
jgi:flagellar export protein FliJ